MVIIKNRNCCIGPGTGDNSGIYRAAGDADADGTVNLSVGQNDIAIVVIPESAKPEDTRVYLLRIKRAGAGDSRQVRT